MHKLKSSLKSNFGRILILVLFIIIWQILQFSASSQLDEESSKNRATGAIRQASQNIIKSDDIVFISSHNASILQDVEQIGVSFYEFDSGDTNGFNTALLEVLDKYCSTNWAQGNHDAYFIWTMDNNQTTMDLSNAARGLNFFFTFQAVLPYEGSNAYAIDKFLRLQPKENIIQRYCEAKRLTITTPVILIIDANEFSPWIGSVISGRVTWLANDPIRKMTNSDYTIINMPPLRTYDVYWLAQLYSNPTWSFENQDMAAYELAVKQGKTQSSIVLVDREARLGITASRYLQKCDNKKTQFESKLFRQMCLK